ncbi:hypothetical protein P692DRAFT_20879597 [Suillus brevipes Sb2]|nr:hypothetical protein P692DRAFT_20879597 [Suillus brevipes Sb2]
MPVVRPPPRRRSARLKALQTPFPRGKNAMDQTQGPVTRGRGSKSRGTWHPAVGGGSDHPKFQIQWLSAPFCTQKVIDHLRDHIRKITLKLLLDLEHICTNIARVIDDHTIDGSLDTKIDEGAIWAGAEVPMDRGGGSSIGGGKCGRGGGPTGVMEESEGMVGALESKPNAFECSVTAAHSEC